MKDLKEIFGKGGSIKQGSRPGFGNGPEGDWKIIFVSAIILIIFISAWNARMFLNINNGDAITSDENIQVSDDGIDIAKLRDTINYYQNKAVEFEKIKSRATSTVVDPSI